MKSLLSIQFFFALISLMTSGLLSAQSSNLVAGGPVQYCHCSTCAESASAPGAIPEGSLPEPLLLLLRFYPMAGNQSEDYGIGNYVDLDPTAGVIDFNCGTFAFNGHAGSDSALSSFDEQIIGVPVYAAADGIVTFTHDGEPDMNTQNLGQVSNLVIIDHGDGIETFYFHLRNGSVLPTVGQNVLAGEMIGMAASSGNSSGPHLHFEIQVNGVVVEPFIGPCNPSPSWWLEQPPLPNEAKLLKWAFSRTSPGLNPPPGSMTRDGFKLLSDNDIYFWYQLEALPANSTGQVQWFRPNGTLYWDTGVFNFGNAIPFGGAWYWQHWSLAELNSTPGQWTVKLRVNGVDMIDAPLDVAATTVANRAPLPVTAAFNAMPANTMGPLICRLTSDHLLADPDWDIVRHRWVWKVNGSTVRDITTAARSDMIPVSLFNLGDTVSCEITPSDGSLSAATTTVSSVIDSGFTYPGSLEDFQLRTAVNGTAREFPDVNPVVAGDLLAIHIESPNGVYDLIPPIIYGQVFVTGVPPFAPPAFPEVHLDFNPGIVFEVLTLYSGFASALSPALLPPGGLTFLHFIPPGLSGLSFMMQAFVPAASPNTGNMFFTASNAHAIDFM